MAEKTTRAYALIEQKSADDATRVITGIATSPRVDRMGDIIEMDGVKVAADIPLFLYHDSELTVGRAKLGKPTKKGIPFEATLPNVVESGALKDRIDEAWQMVRYKLITAVSIGFRALEYAFIDNGGVRFIESEVMELSLVPVPAQPDAIIESFKSADPAARERLLKQIQLADQAARRTALGAQRGHVVVRLDSPPASPGAPQTKRKGAVYL